MSEYDSGASYDSGLHYADALPPTPIIIMAKHKVKLDLKAKSDLELKEFAEQHILKMTGNANFTTKDPDEATFQAGSDDFGTALTESNSAQETAKEKTAAKEAARAVLESLLTDRGSFVERKSGGQKPKILSAGFDVKGEGTPSGVPGQVGNLALTTGDSTGELGAQWDPISGGKITYEIQTSPDPATAGSWTHQPLSTKSKTILGGLPSGTRVWVRVRAVGPGGEGAWSSPVLKMVP